MKIKRYLTGPLEVNTYLICDEDSKECIIIDLGSQIDQIYKEIKEKGYDLKYILNTHGHFDHIWGEKEAQEKYKLEVYIHEEDKQLVNNLEKIMQNWGFTPQSPPKCKTFNENSELYIGNKKIEIYHTPGHTKGGCCFLIEDNLFSGDTLFKESIGRTDLEDGNYDDLINSIKTKLLKLKPEIKVYPGHGETTTIGYEKNNNSYIK